MRDWGGDDGSKNLLSVKIKKLRIVAIFASNLLEISGFCIDIKVMGVPRRQAQHLLVSRITVTRESDV
jgi:hypothetical protein